MQSLEVFISQRKFEEAEHMPIPINVTRTVNYRRDGILAKIEVLFKELRVFLSKIEIPEGIIYLAIGISAAIPLGVFIRYYQEDAEAAIKKNKRK